VRQAASDEGYGNDEDHQQNGMSDFCFVPGARACDRLEGSCVSLEQESLEQQEPIETAVVLGVFGLDRGIDFLDVK
jgi:hypothetical protein